MDTSALSRQLGLGKLALKFYYRPLGRIRNSLRHGGPFAQHETDRQRREMEVAAKTLPLLPHASDGAPIVHLMTGRRFWYQTAFCLHSLVRAAGCGVRAELYDDGTIDEECAALLNQLGTSVRINFQSGLRAKLDSLLPDHRYPVLRDRWEKYPNIRKLIDVHLGATGWKLVLDSDLLFFRRPTALLEWLQHPKQLLHAIDCTESYGYSRAVLEEIAGVHLPAKVNVGICGLRSDSIDWEQLERWTAELQQRESTNYYLEQALVAMLAAREPAVAVSPDEYITMPNRDEVVMPTAVMHHYVDTAKRWYFRHGWRHISGKSVDAK